MDSCRVFVLYSQSLFAEGVIALLGQQEGVKVVGMETNQHLALDSIRRLRPDVVVFDSTEQDPAYTIGCLLKECPGTRLITLSLKDNKMKIYDNYQVVTPSPTDLIKAVLVPHESAATDQAEGRASI